MTISQPSKEIYVVEVPEVKELTATFIYNFFTPDESVNATGGVPSNILMHPSGEVDASFIQYSVTRAPRLVQFNYAPARLSNVGNQTSDVDHRTNTFGSTGAQDGSLIIDNIDKVVNEDFFASNNYVAIGFHDGQIDRRVHQLVSSSIELHTLEEEHDSDTSAYRAAQRLIPLLPGNIKPHFITKAAAQLKPSAGVSFFQPAGSSDAAGKKSGLLDTKTRTIVADGYYDRLKKVNTHAQVGAKLLADLVASAIKDPYGTAPGDMVNLHGYAKQAKQAVNQRFSAAVSDQDYKTFVPFISVQKQNTAGHAQKYGAEVVGFIIDKVEILPDASTVKHPPIVIDNPNSGLTADYQVKFNSTYSYAIRTVLLLTLPGIDDDTGEVATLKVLVSSRPSAKLYVTTTEFDSPPPPGDINFVWNYETNKLLVTWAFPVTSERDIKQFQVFRRDSIDHPFELQKVYNFDDSVVKFHNTEMPDPRLVEHLISPATFWIDDEFGFDTNYNADNSFIYTVVAIDAHGLTSNYGAQYRVWFDRFKNRLQKELVSHTGAPKPYPNLYIEGQLFRNTIKVSGNHAKRLKLYFNPEYYYLYDDQNRYVKVLQTAQAGGSYKLQFFNTDNLKGQAIDIVIDDQLKVSQSPIATPSVQFGPRRRPRGTP